MFKMDFEFKILLYSPHTPCGSSYSILVDFSINLAWDDLSRWCWDLYSRPLALYIPSLPSHLHIDDGW
jgi:hypothetical protein